MIEAFNEIKNLGSFLNAILFIVGQIIVLAVVKSQVGDLRTKVTAMNEKLDEAIVAQAGGKVEIKTLQEKDERLEVRMDGHDAAINKALRWQAAANIPLRQIDKGWVPPNGA